MESTPIEKAVQEEKTTTKVEASDETPETPEVVSENKPNQNTTKDEKKEQQQSEKQTDSKEEAKEEKVKEEAKDETKEEVKEKPKMEANEKPKENSKDENKEKTKEEAKEEAKDEAKEESKDDTKDEAEENPKEETKEKPKMEANEKPKEKFKDENKEKTKEEAKEESKEEIKDDTKDEAKENPKEDTKNEEKKNPKDEAKEEEEKEKLKEEAKDETKEDTKDEAKENPKEDTKNEAKEEEEKEKLKDEAKEETKEESKPIELESETKKDEVVKPEENPISAEEKEKQESKQNQEPEPENTPALPEEENPDQKKVETNEETREKESSDVSIEVRKKSEEFMSQLKNTPEWSQLKEISDQRQKDADNELSPPNLETPAIGDEQADPAVNAEEPVVEEIMEPKIITKCLKLSEMRSLSFGIVFPGQIKEQKFVIENPSKHKLTLKVKVDCSNDEYDDLDEYVFSIRKPPQYDYNDTYYVMMNEKDFITFQVAIKVPKMREKKTLKGAIKVTAEDFEGEFAINLIAETVVPIIKCPKVIFIKEYNMEVAPFNLKFMRKQDFRFPIKVFCPKNLKFSCELEFHNGDNSNCMFTFRSLQRILSLQDTNGASHTVPIEVKSTQMFEEKGKEGMRDIRKLLLLKVTNSTLIYSFPMLFQYYKK